ncbi:ERI2 exoribonuclease, partial [Ceuthmochares aereus]|nr:ERI2 exoribonuclease [Ceuthmochares aereus]
AFYNRKPKGLSGALQDLGLTFTGREHCGLDDSRNTARLAWRMICDGCVLKVTKSLDKAHTKNNLISRTLTINFTDKASLGSNSRPEISRDGTCKTNSLAEKKQNGIAGMKINSNVQTEEQQTTSTDSSADVHVVPSSSSRTELRAQAQSSSTASTDRFPVPLEWAQQSPSTVLTGIRQGLSNGQPLSTARYSPGQGSGLVLVSTTLSSVNIASEDISTSSDCLSLLTDWEDVALIPESQCEQNSDSVQFKDDSSTDTLRVLEEKTISKQSAAGSSGNPSLEKSVVPVEPLKSIIYKSPDTTIYNVGTVQRQSSLFSAFKLPSAKINATSPQPALTGNYSVPLEVSKRKPTSPKRFPPAKKQSFAIYQEKNASSDHSFPLESSNLPRVSPAILNSTVNLNQSARAVKNGKPTPPLCNCGRRAKKLYVSNAGPNHGKAFFCCPVGKHEGNKKSCGYFKWEHALLKEKSNGVPLNAGALTPLGTYASNLGNYSNKKYLCLRPSMRS